MIDYEINERTPVECRVCRWVGTRGELVNGWGEMAGEAMWPGELQERVLCPSCDSEDVVEVKRDEEG